MSPFVKSASIITLLLTPLAAVAQEIDLAKLKPLIMEAAEELRGALLKSELTSDEYRTIMDVSCNALAALSQDSDFRVLLRAYQERQYDEGLSTDVRELFLNFRSLLEFLVVERDLLLDAGVSEAAADELLGQILRVRLEAAGFRLDADALQVNLRSLAEQACSVAHHVSDLVGRREMMCNIAWIAPAVLGGVAVIVDLPLAFTPGGQIHRAAGAPRAPTDHPAA